MKNIIIILSLLQLLFLGACSGNSVNTTKNTESDIIQNTDESKIIDVEKGQIILLGNENNFNEISCETSLLGGSKISFYSGKKKKVFRLKEKYDFNEYNHCNIALWDSKHKKFVMSQMKQFDVYINIEQRLMRHPEIKGCALQLPDGELLTIMSFKENHGLIQRTIPMMEASPIYDDLIEGHDKNRGNGKTCLVHVHYQDLKASQWFVLPVYHTVKKNQHSLYSSCVGGHIDLLKKKEKRVILPCTGIPEITCEPAKDGYSRICVKGADDGKDKEFVIKGRYDYTKQMVYDGTNEIFTDQVAGAAFLSEEGEYLILLQLPEDAASVKKIHTKHIIDSPEPEYRKYDCEIRINVILDNRRGRYYEIPIYLPQ